MITILYGEMGSGKNYQGERLARKLGAQFLDGDTLLPPDLQARVKAFKPLTPEMLDRYIGEHVLPRLVATKDQDLVFAQALYLRGHRKIIQVWLDHHGIDCQFNLVSVPWRQNMRQLWGRPNGARWVLYWLMNKPFFQR